MSWRAAARHRRYSNRQAPRGLARKLLDGAIVVTILFLIAVIAARLDRVETKRISGDAVINDGDSITLKGERIAEEFQELVERYVERSYREKA